jgi:hypothetical protein
MIFNFFSKKKKNLCQNFIKKLLRKSRNNVRWNKDIETLGRGIENGKTRQKY